MGFIWQTIILNPIFNILVVFYKLTGNLGFAIILFTIAAKTLLLPATIPSIKMRKKQRDLQPKLDALKKKYKNNKQKQAEKQMELFKKHGVSPGAGCLTTIFTFILMIAVYRSVSTFTGGTEISVMNEKIYFDSLKFLQETKINTDFLYLDLTQSDPYLIVTLLAVGLQFLLNKMMLPITKATDKATAKTPGKTDDLMQSMQKQNLYIMPIMFFIFGITLPSGVIIYIITSMLYQIIQTYYFSGWGGLKPWINKLKSVKNTTAKN